MMIAARATTSARPVASPSLGGPPTGFQALLEAATEVLRPGEIEEELSSIDRDRCVAAPGRSEWVASRASRR